MKYVVNISKNSQTRSFEYTIKNKKREVVAHGFYKGHGTNMEIVNEIKKLYPQYFN